MNCLYLWVFGDGLVRVDDLKRKARFLMGGIVGERFVVVNFFSYVFLLFNLELDKIEVVKFF